jgi:hypothetical protein
MIYPNLTGRRRARASNHVHGPGTVTEGLKPKVLGKYADNTFLAHSAVFLRRQVYSPHEPI